MSDLHLDVDAQVVRQLGEELITDAEQAILELVKNSYDADASWCYVNINRTFKNIKDDSGLTGRIIVKDNGTGMTLEDIRRGWLTISLSPKREMKLRGGTTKKYKRTPIGDKGLGRLGTMKLGNKLEIETYIDPKKMGYKVSFLWNDCKSGLPLSDVPISVKEIPPIGKAGTLIVIEGLTEPNYWKGERRKKDLRLKLSTLISPFKSFEDFIIAVEVDGKELDLITIPNKFLEIATTYFGAVWDDNYLELSGKIKIDILKGKQAEFFKYHVLSDTGKSFFKHLNKKNEIKVVY